MSTHPSAVHCSQRGIVVVEVVDPPSLTAEVSTTTLPPHPVESAAHAAKTPAAATEITRMRMPLIDGDPGREASRPGQPRSGSA